MPTQQSAWTHGTSVQFQTQSWAIRALRQGFWTTVTPSTDATSGWVHFAIPTVGVNLKAQLAMIRFSTGPQASIGAIHVFDGETLILQKDSLNLKGNLQFHPEPIPSKPEVKWGTGISLLLNFSGTGTDAWINLIGAGMEFV